MAKVAVASRLLTDFLNANFKANYYSMLCKEGSKDPLTPLDPCELAESAKAYAEYLAKTLQEEYCFNFETLSFEEECPKDAND